MGGGVAFGHRLKAGMSRDWCLAILCRHFSTVMIYEIRGGKQWKRETGYQILGFMKGIRKPQEILKLKVLYVHVRSQDIVAVN